MREPPLRDPFVHGLEVKQAMKRNVSYLQVRVIWEWLKQEEIPGNRTYQSLANELIVELGRKRFLDLASQIPNDHNADFEAIKASLK